MVGTARALCLILRPCSTIDDSFHQDRFSPNIHYNTTVPWNMIIDGNGIDSKWSDSHPRSPMMAAGQAIKPSNNPQNSFEPSRVPLEHDPTVLYNVITDEMAFSVVMTCMFTRWATNWWDCRLGWMGQNLLFEKYWTGDGIWWRC